MRAITVPCSVDFMAVSSYGDGVKSSGVVRIVKDLDTKVEGRHVIVAEDILDSGLTLSYLVKLLQSRKPASIEIAAFSVKDIPNHTPAVTPRYVGAHVPDAFVVGYGLDYAERYRNLPYTASTTPSATATCPTWAFSSPRSTPSSAPAPESYRKETFSCQTTTRSTSSPRREVTTADPRTSAALS